jgi:hypothetical protein
VIARLETVIKFTANFSALSRPPNQPNLDTIEVQDQLLPEDDFQSRSCQYPGCPETRVFKQNSGFKYAKDSDPPLQGALLSIE